MPNHYDRLASYFAHIAVTQGPQAIRGDEIEAMPDTPTEPRFDDSDQDRRPLEAFQSIGSEPERLVSADFVFPPAESCGPFGSQSVFASFATLGCTVFSFSFAPLGSDGGTDDLGAVAKSYCAAHGLELLGSCFAHDTLQTVAIVRGTRDQTEAGIVTLWAETEASAEEWAEWRAERLEPKDHPRKATC